MILENIKKYCKERGISIYSLEKQAGIGNGTVDDWDHCKPRIDKLQAVASVLGVSIEELLKEP